MTDYGLVLNAGSSSLKFCVYQRPEASTWKLEAQGKVDGLGSAPRAPSLRRSGGGRRRT